MSRFLYRLGRSSARHPWRVVGAWLLIALTVFSLRSAVGGETTDDFALPGTETQAATDLLQEEFPTQSGASGQIVFHADGEPLTEPGTQATVAATLGALRQLDQVVDVTDPFDPAKQSLSPDGETAFSTVTFSEQTIQAADVEAVEEAIAVGRDAGLQVEISGSIAQAAQEVEGNEGIGLAVAVVVLLVAFGSVIAMGIPIGTALFGVAIGLAGVGVLAGFADVPSVSPMLATMIGLGVGIDYALFVVTRHRHFLADGLTVDEAAGRANATAGQSVLFAGATVVIAICGLWVSGIPSIAMMGFASAILVAVSMFAAVTLLPAFLGLSGTWIDRLHVGRRRRPAVVPASAGSAGSSSASSATTWSGRWAHHVGRRPWRYAVASFAALLALGAPVLSLRIAFADDGNAAPGSTQRLAYDLLAEGFGAGFNGPLTIVVDGADDAAVSQVGAALASTPGIASITPAQPSPSGTTAVLFAYPTTSPQDEATDRLVHALRDDVLPQVESATGSKVYVSGWTAAQLDISERLGGRLPVFIAAVVILSFLLLMVVFRSIVVPLKAALMNLLSIGAAYGVIVAVFQWGWAKGLIGLEETVPVNPFVPMIMFAILFGLSMDYEVFLLSRVREEYLRSGDSHHSVVEGLTATARVITSAALIMISVFGAFVLTDDVIIKMFGVGLATAVLIDATIVRMVLVPSTMALLGGANWWLPAWLDRLLPHVDVEGEAMLAELGSTTPSSVDGEERVLVGV
jgi:putative drug exporter of the RND superfamily